MTDRTVLHGLYLVRGSATVDQVADRSGFSYVACHLALERALTAGLVTVACSGVFELTSTGEALVRKERGLPALVTA